jgi:Nif-specific regulatory protein
MSENPLDLIASIAAIAAEPRGLRSDCQRIIEAINKELETLFVFVYLKNFETDAVEVVAATGLDAVTFRRLEERIDRTALTRIFDTPVTTRLLVNDEPSLDLLRRPAAALELICEPVRDGSRSAGSLTAAFDKRKGRPNASVLKTLEITSAIIAGLINSGEVREVENQKRIEENVSLRREIKKRYDLSRLVGNSSPMRSVMDKVAQIARSNATVLVRGESGTGKELIATAIHHNSLRAKGPFVKVNCSALPDTLVDAEIFGDAMSSRPKLGRVEEAEGGTLFLDEIGDLSQQTQIRLLRLLQDREYERTGDSETRPANVRIVSASSRDLEASVDDGLLRNDLFLRLNIFTIHLPALRERKSDILLLADHFLKKYAREHKKDVLRISTPAIDMLTAYHFPGNVRELENAIETAVLASNEAVIHSHHLPPTLQTAEQSGTQTRVTLESAVGAFERDIIQDALKSTRGNVAKAAVMLDSTERILGYKIKKHGILPKRFK